jgi:hypothetical protein
MKMKMGIRQLGWFARYTTVSRLKVRDEGLDMTHHKLASTGICFALSRICIMAGRFA